MCWIIGFIWLFFAHIGAADTLRSSLYPEDWTPGYQDAEGRFLHDFSYAGYRNGEAPIPQREDAEIFDVVAGFGADNTGETDATRAIQNAIDAASDAGGGVVFLPAGLYRCEGLLEITRSNIILRGAGAEKTQLYFTKVEGMTGQAHITFRGDLKTGWEYPLVEDGENLSDSVLVLGGDTIAPGDDLAVGWEITPAFVEEHGMEEYWKPFRGQWQAVFQRNAVAVESRGGSVLLTLDVPLRYAAKVRDKAAVHIRSGYLEECGIEHLSVATAVSMADAWGQNRSHAIAFDGVKDCWAREVHSFASPHPDAGGYHLQSGGILVKSSKRVTVADCSMGVAQNRGGGGNGYLFEVMQSNEVLTVDCTGYNGRHNFIQNWGFGTAGCVWLRCESRGGRNLNNRFLRVGPVAYSEYHHALAMACLVDSCTLEDGWLAGNRHHYSSGAGHTSTQCVFWNNRGGGAIYSWQYGMGYVIGSTGLTVQTSRPYLTTVNYFDGTAPEDFTEHLGNGAQLQPQSLYLDQLDRRLGR